jgi:taurine dioxygenase
MTLDLTPITPVIGAEVRGLDLSRPLDAAAVTAVRAAWLEHLVLFFPDQWLEPGEQTAFAAQFGELTAAHPVEPAHDDDERVLPIDSQRGNRVDFWHTDVTFMSRPPSGSVLFALEVPQVGGDTMWASSRCAYDRLSEPLRDLCDRLRAVHFDEGYARLVDAGQGKEWEGHRIEQLTPVEHPVVRVHPETGAKSLFVNPKFTRRISGLAAHESDALLRLLYEHATRPEMVCRHRWEPGTVAMWDNRATMHYGLYDYGDARRVMHRVTLQGDRPAGPPAR